MRGRGGARKEGRWKGSEVEPLVTLRFQVGAEDESPTKGPRTGQKRVSPTVPNAKEKVRQMRTSHLATRKVVGSFAWRRNKTQVIAGEK